MQSGGRGCKTYPSARKHVFQLHPGVAKQGVRVVLKPGTDDESWRIHEENLRSWKEKQASYNAQRMARQHAEGGAALVSSRDEDVRRSSVARPFLQPALGTTLPSPSAGGPLVLAASGRGCGPQHDPWSRPAKRSRALTGRASYRGESSRRGHGQHEGEDHGLKDSGPAPNDVLWIDFLRRAQEGGWWPMAAAVLGKEGADVGDGQDCSDLPAWWGLMSVHAYFSDVGSGLQVTNSLDSDLALRQSAEVGLLWFKRHRHVLTRLLGREPEPSFLDYDPASRRYSRARGIHIRLFTAYKWMPCGGASAGAAILLALLKLLYRVPIPPMTVATGAVTLSGYLMAVDSESLQRKILASAQGRASVLLMPVDNHRGLDHSQRPGVRTVAVENALDLFHLACGPVCPALAAPIDPSILSELGTGMTLVATVASLAMRCHRFPVEVVFERPGTGRHIIMGKNGGTEQWRMWVEAAVTWVASHQRELEAELSRRQGRPFTFKEDLGALRGVDLRIHVPSDAHSPCTMSALVVGLVSAASGRALREGRVVVGGDFNSLSCLAEGLRLGPSFEVPIADVLPTLRDSYCEDGTIFLINGVEAAALRASGVQAADVLQVTTIFDVIYESLAGEVLDDQQQQHQEEVEGRDEQRRRAPFYLWRRGGMGVVRGALEKVKKVWLGAGGGQSWA